MAAPSATARGTPSGRKLRNGHPTKITFKDYPTISLWEKSTKPPGVSGGDAIDQTTAHSVTWREKAARTLKELTDCTGKCAYDPAVLSTLLSLVNVDTTITLTFPEGSTWAFYGFLREFMPNELSEGNQPEADYTITPTNFDLTGNVESGPTVVSVAGT